MKYNFYYDETEHSRKISLETITASNYYDNFISVIVGWTSEDGESVMSKYLAFEEKYGYRKKNGELKSQTMKTRDFKLGFASLNNHTIELYEDLISLFDNKIIIYFSVFSKIEYVINQLFSEYHNSWLVDVDSKKIVMTGGGTAGHVTPNIALMPALRNEGFEISYIGSYEGIEKRLIEEQGVPYYGISSGKLRRYFDPKNFSDPFKVLKGYAQSIRLLKKIKPDVVFSKGGFVSVPVVLAAKHCKVPAIIHESDLTPGLANKLAIPSATKVCCNFPETLSYLPKEKAVLTGSPIRQELLTGNADFAFSLCHFKDHSKQTILIVGGSSGSRVINTAIRGLLPELLKNYNVIHLCGKGNMDDTLTATDGYAQFEYANKELSDMFALADLVISRAGANAICELLALRKPNILIPLSAAASRGDQILNANSFRSQGFSYVLEEEELSNTTLLEAIEHVFHKKEAYIEAMENSNSRNSIDTIIGLILDASKK